MATQLVTVEVRNVENDPRGVFLEAEFPARGRGYQKLQSVTLKVGPINRTGNGYHTPGMNFRIWDGHNVYREVATERDAVKEFYAALGWITVDRAGIRHQWASENS